LHEAVNVVNWLNLVAFVGLAAIALRGWYVRRDDASAWAAAAFATLGIVVLLGRLLPEDPHEVWQRVILRGEIVVLLFFPYLLYRFTWVFARPPRRLTWVVSTMTTALVIWTLALPRLPQSDEPLPGWFAAYVVAFLVHWTFLTAVVGVRLWRAGRGQPGVARRRMQMLAFGSVGITIALLVSASGAPKSAVTLAGGLIGFLSAIGFMLALSPPRLVRFVWQRPEARRMQDAIASLMQFATTEQEVATRVLGPMSAIVGARGTVLRNSQGEIVGSYNVAAADARRFAAGAPATDEANVLRVDLPGGGTLTVWTTPYAPFFGEDELRLLRTLGALTGLALDRARLFAQEREARLALERANEVKANFVALAAHELRTPISAVHGVARTLTGRRDVLAPDQRFAIEDVLAEQTERLVALTEQLLDLSRLDADVIRIEPKPFAVRARTEALVVAVAAESSELVRVEIDPRLEVVADPQAFDRIVSNLIANALRYGEPPIVVRAERERDEFRIAVQDHGPGVAEEFVPSLFERFARGEASAQAVSGTGLGLAIARSYARAHDGDVTYEPARPRGARFQLILPA